MLGERKLKQYALLLFLAGVWKVLPLWSAGVLVWVSHIICCPHIYGFHIIIYKLHIMTPAASTWSFESFTLKEMGFTFTLKQMGFTFTEFNKAWSLSLYISYNWIYVCTCSFNSLSLLISSWRQCNCTVIHCTVYRFSDSRTQARGHGVRDPLYNTELYTYPPWCEYSRDECVRIRIE